jgi:hypothetical protein
MVSVLRLQPKRPSSWNRGDHSYFRWDIYTYKSQILNSCNYCFHHIVFAFVLMDRCFRSPLPTHTIPRRSSSSNNIKQGTRNNGDETYISYSLSLKEVEHPRTKLLETTHPTSRSNQLRDHRQKDFGVVKIPLVSSHSQMFASNSTIPNDIVFVCFHKNRYICYHKDESAE